MQTRTLPGVHSSLALPAVLLYDLGAGLNLWSSFRRKDPAFRFDPVCHPHLRLSDLSVFGLQPDSPPVLSERNLQVQPLLRGLEIPHIPSQSHRLHTMWFAVLIVLVCQDPKSSRSSLATSSGLLPESWLCACLPSTPSPGLSSSTWRLLPPWPPIFSQAHLQMAPADSPGRRQHSGVQDEQACPPPALGPLVLSGCHIAPALGYPSPYSQA